MVFIIEGSSKKIQSNKKQIEKIKHKQVIKTKSSDKTVKDAPKTKKVKKVKVKKTKKKKKQHKRKFPKRKMTKNKPSK